MCEWLFMPLVTLNALTTIMRLMNDILHPFVDSFAIVYLYDILVYNATWEENISHLTQLLETLKKHQLLENLNKYEFAQQSLVYLGYAIGGGDMKIYPSNMEGIMKWPVPTIFLRLGVLLGQQNTWGNS